MRRAWRSSRKLNAAVEERAAVISSAIDDPADAGLVQFGEQRAARIGRDRSDRAGARAEPEPMQGQRGRTFGIERHDRNPQTPPGTGIDRPGARQAAENYFNSGAWNRPGCNQIYR